MLPEGLRNFFLRTFCCHADNTGIKKKMFLAALKKNLNSMFFTLTVYNDYRYAQRAAEKM